MENKANDVQVCIQLCQSEDKLKEEFDLYEAIAVYYCSDLYRLDLKANRGQGTVRVREPTIAISYGSSGLIFELDSGSTDMNSRFKGGFSFQSGFNHNVIAPKTRHVVALTDVDTKETFNFENNGCELMGFIKQHLLELTWQRKKAATYKIDLVDLSDRALVIEQLLTPYKNTIYGKPDLAKLENNNSFLIAQATLDLIGKSLIQTIGYAFERVPKEGRLFMIEYLTGHILNKSSSCSDEEAWKRTRGNNFWGTYDCSKLLRLSRTLPQGWSRLRNDPQLIQKLLGNLKANGFTPKGDLKRWKLTQEKKEGENTNVNQDV